MREFVALGVAAEVVVVIEQQDAGLGTGRAEVMGGRQAADAGADHHQVVLLTGDLRRGRGFPEGAVLHGVEDLERAGVRSAQAGQCRRIRIGLALGEQGREVRRQRPRCGGADANGHAVQEVTARDRGAHA